LGLPNRLVHQHVASGFGDRCCYRDPVAGEVSYARLSRAVTAFAAQLRARGMRPGEYGLVVSDDTIEAVVAIVGLWEIGCIPVPVSPLLTDPEIGFMAADCGAALMYLGVPEPRRSILRALPGPRRWIEPVVATRALSAGRPDAPDAPDGPDAPDVAGPAPGEESPGAEVLLQYTSGSTGTPKGVRQSLGGLLAIVAGFGTAVPLQPDDVVLSTAKLTFGYGFGSSLLWTLGARAQAVLRPGPADVPAVLAAIRQYRPTVLCTVPRMYAMLADHASDPGDLGSVRLALSAGEYLPDGLARRFSTAFQVRMLDALGATEVGHIVLVRDAAAGGGACPVPSAQVSVRDEAGRELPAGEPGRLHVAGPSVALGYLHRPAEDAAVFAGGGAYTQDIVRRTADGRFAYLCRADDLLNVGGFKISPAEVEAVAGAVPGVAGCAVIGERDENGLDQIVAYVVPEPGSAAVTVRRAVAAAARGKLAAYKRPARVEIVDALPTTSTGKLARHRLRAREGAASP
jgi:acyl-coenzyme A synthetase/AMP-(fatty) acid ligase